MPSFETDGSLIARMRRWAKAIKRDVHALYLSARDPRVPWYAKAVALAVAAYALSPIDLIPDFIPILGYLDDIILVPLGILLAVRLIPPEILRAPRNGPRRAAPEKQRRCHRHRRGLDRVVARPRGSRPALSGSRSDKLKTVR